MGTTSIQFIGRAQKIFEKIENMQETNKLIESEINLNNSNENLLLWKK